MNELLETLAAWWLFDLIVFTKWWLYAPLCIPFAVYTAFFFVKWTLITAPFWLPLSIVMSKIRRVSINVTGRYAKPNIAMSAAHQSKANEGNTNHK